MAEGDLKPWDLEQWPRFREVGKPHPRLEGPLKVTGRAKYTYDVQLPGMLFGRMIGAAIPAGEIVSIDTSKAEALPGVRAVWTTDSKIVRFAGQDVAAVAAVSADVARDAGLTLARVRTWALRLILCQGLRDSIQRRRFKEAFGVPVLREQGCNFFEESLILRAGCLEKSFAPWGLEFQRRVVNLLNLSPALRIHPLPPDLISRSSQAFATAQSRFTVLVETPITDDDLKRVLDKLSLRGEDVLGGETHE